MVEQEGQYLIFKNSVYILFNFFIFISCGSSGYNIDKKNTINKLFFVPDTTINNRLVLRNPFSVENFYKDTFDLFPESKENQFPVVYFCNKDTTEYLAIYHYYGDLKNQFSLFEVGYCSKLKKNVNVEFVRTSNESFVTESNISLKRNRGEIINIKGEDFFLRTDNQKTIMRYELNDYENSLFLKEHKMPAYFLEISIEDDKIIMFKFGFVYP